ncbi:MAG TPA: hypothetical protein VJN71_10335, partial [Nitrososphaerales archaeon]|nr:hypothetical protein [Nitrososphaerales archaeon]
SAAAANSITKLSSGLVHYDPLNQPSNASSGVNIAYWNLYGDAESNAGHYYANENTSGLFIGAASLQSGSYEGFYAESPNENVVLYHTLLILPYATLPSSLGAYFNTGLYVQTDNGLINYVTCDGESQSGGSTYTWALVNTTGNYDEALSYTTLWSRSYPTSDTADLTQSCTIVTNGSNFLELYMNGALVYSNNKLNLNIPPPFNAYLEVETTSRQLLYGQYLDYYDTSGTSLAVDNVPSGDTVQIVGSNGSIIASAVASSTFMSASGIRSDPALIVDSANSFGNAITGLKTTLSRSNGAVVNSKNTPATYSLRSGAHYKIQADGNATCTFSHWEGGSIGGSTLDPVAISITTRTKITAIYTGSNCGNQTTTTSTSTSSLSSSTSTDSTSSSSFSSSSNSTISTNSTSSSSSSSGSTTNSISTTSLSTLSSSSSTSTSSVSTGPPVTVSFEIAQFNLPISGTIEVLDGNTIVSSGPVSIWAGDAYQFGSSSTSTSSTTKTTTVTSTQTTTTSSTTTTSGTSNLVVDSENTLGNAITGYYTVLYNSSGSVQSINFTPATYTLKNGATYSIRADSYGSCTFAYWKGDGISGSTSDPARISITSHTTIDAVYSGSSCGVQTPSTKIYSSTTRASASTPRESGVPAAGVITVYSQGSAISGYYTAYIQSGAQIRSCYSACSFNVCACQAYQVIAVRYGYETFRYWANDSSTLAETSFLP